MKFRILGPLEVSDSDGRPVTIQRPQHRRLIGVLLIYANQLRTYDQLAEALWGEQLPAMPRYALRTFVCELRRLLDDDGRLRTHSSGYVLDLASDDVDLCVFERLIAQGRVALGHGDTPEAADLLRRGLQMWRDPPFTDLPSTPLMDIEVIRLTELRRTMTVAYFETRLTLGHHKEIIPDLTALTAADPLDETVWATLILALYRCGRTADALAAYSRARTELTQKSGVDPGRTLSGLQQRILARDPELDRPDDLAGLRFGP